MSRVVFTRQSVDGRVWFAIVTNKGELRTGAAGSCTVTIVDPDDSASTAAVASESSSKPGLYYFTIPTAFMAANGVGEYAASVEVDVTSTPRVKAATVFGVKVTQNDIDSLGIDSAALEMLQFGAKPAVHIDTKNGAAGTAFPLGTEWAPVSNIADGLVIAAARGINTFHIRGTVTLTDAVDDWTFVGEGAEAELNFAGFGAADSEFHNMSLTGTIGGSGAILASRCHLNGLSGLRGSATQCSLSAATVTLSGDMRFEHCSSAVAGTGTPTVDANGIVGLSAEFRSYAGGVRLINVTDAGASASIDMIAGQVVVDASCTAGTLALRGVGKLTNAGAMTIERSAFLSLPEIESAVLDASLSGHVVAGTVGGAIMSAAAQGLLNCVDDNFSYVGAPDGVPSSFRRRVFVDAAAAAAATPGAADGADGEIARFLGTAVYSGTEPTDTLLSMNLQRVL